MVKDKPEPGKMLPTPEVEPEEIPTEEPIETPEIPTEPEEIEQPEVSVDGKPINPETGEPEVEVKAVKPIESTETRETFYFVNPKTGASMEIEMTPAEVIKELKKLGKGWELSDKTDVETNANPLDLTYTENEPEEEEDILKVGDKRDYLNRFGNNVEIEIVNQDEDGNFYAKPIMHYTDVKGQKRSKMGPEFIIPRGRMQNIGSKVMNTPENTDEESLLTKLRKKQDLDNVEAEDL